MTINTQKLREAAQAVIDDSGDDWYDAGVWKIMGDDRPPVVDEQFIEVATPMAVVGLIDALDAQAAEIARLREALTDATAHLAAAASAYRTHASRSRSITPRSVADPFFTIRAHDFDGAVERARAALAQEQGESK